MKKFLILIFVLLGTTISQAQDLNSYNHVIVPYQFEFLKEPDQYQLNSLTKFLFEKYGFEAYFQGEEISGEISKNPCESLVAGLENNSGLFKTRLKVFLKDCYNKQVFISKEGESRKKDFKEAYQEALRIAFESLEELNYSPNEAIISARPEMPKNSKISKDEKELDEPAKVSIPLEIKPQEKSIQEINNSDSNIFLIRDNSRFYLRKTANGYNFYQEGMAEPFAALVKSSSGVNFIYSAINSQGMAHFDEAGNLVVEVLDSGTGNLETIKYKIQP